MILHEQKPDFLLTACINALTIYALPSALNSEQLMFNPFLMWEDKCSRYQLHNRIFT